MTKPQLFHCLSFRDADAAIAFLTAVGFTERLIVRDGDDPAHVAHAQFGWRDNGGIMLGPSAARRPHGGRNGCVRDAEGNLWNVDSYPGA